MENKVYKYGCLMVTFEIPDWESYINNYITNKDDIYNEDGFGIENNPHITVLYGFNSDVSHNELKEYLLPLHQIGVTFNSIDSFQNDLYDVLKFNCSSQQLSFMNSVLIQDFPITNDHPEYNAHMTIGYLQPGTSSKYHKKLSKPFTLIPKEYYYSYPDGKKELFTI